MLGGAGGGDAGRLARYYRDGGACGTPRLDNRADREGLVAYYAPREAAGRWVGDGAAALGLTGPLDAGGVARFTALLEGVVDGRRVAGPVWRAAPGSTADPSDGHAATRVDARRVGIDVTVSAPKSVSVLHGLTPDPAVAAAVARCHDLAVGEALGYLQRHAGHGIRGHYGDGRHSTIGTGGWVGAGFTHATSRADDPQLHTHLVIANVLHGDDGRWSAIDSRAVFRHAKTAGYLYQAALRHYLTLSLGVEWTSPVKGVAEISGIPREALREFSTRRRQISAALAGRGITPGNAAGDRGTLTRGRRRAAQAATLATRPAKTHLPNDGLRQGWVARAAAHRLAPEALRVRRGRVTPFPPMPELGELAARLFGPDGLTKSRTEFDRRDVVQALCELLPAHAAADSMGVEWLAAQLLEHPDALALTSDPGQPERGGVFTSRDLARAERRALDLADTLIRPGLPDWERIRRGVRAAVAATGTRLSAEQHMAVLSLASAGHLASVLVGPAGSGKTAALATLHRYWRDQGRPVIGAALAALTAQRLETGSGIPSRSIASLLHHLDTPDPTTGTTPGLPRGVVLVVDEAGMVGTRDLARLMTHARAAGGQVLLVGDPAQLPEIDAGGLFAHLAHPDRQPAELTGNQRQVNPWERQALRDLRRGSVDAAVLAYSLRGRIQAHPDRDTVLDKIAADYLTTGEDRAGTVVLATTRADVTALNELIRARLQTSGELPPDAVVLRDADGQPLSLAVGDQMLNSRNLRTGTGQRLLNGTRLTVTAADDRSVTVTDGTRRHVLDHPTARAVLRHGYATTIHKAQGVTAEHALVLADGLTGRAAYTALSRARHTTRLYATTDRDPRQQLVDDLSRDSGHRLALPRLADPSRRPDPSRSYEPARDRTVSRGR